MKPDWSDKTVDWYAENFGDDPSVFAVVNGVSLAETDDVLDISCGTGSALRALREKTSGRLVGVDFIERMIDHAIRLTPVDKHIEYVVSGAEKLPFKDQEFDIVFAINAVEHWTDMKAGFAEVHRVLRPNGVFVIGGEVFEDGLIESGQKYADKLMERGFSNVEYKTIPEGFIEIITKGHVDV